MRPEYDVGEPITQGQAVVLKDGKLYVARVYTELFGIAREALVPGDRAYVNDIGQVFRVEP